MPSAIGTDQLPDCDDVVEGDGRPARSSAGRRRRRCRRRAPARRRSRRRRARWRRALHLGLHAARVEGAVGGEPGPAQLVAQHRRLGAAGDVDDEGVDGVGRRANTPSASAASSVRSTPSAKPMPGGGRAAELLDEAVVAAAATEGVLAAPSAAGVLEGGGRVVVEARARAGRRDEAMPRLQPGLHALEVRRRGSSDRWSRCAARSRRSGVLGRFESSTRSGFLEVSRPPRDRSSTLASK